MTDCNAECQCHISPHTHVPVCREHRLPLYAAEAGQGQCPWVGAGATHHVRGVRLSSHRCITWGPGNWLWMPRDVFDWRDLPPHNGYQPPRYPALDPPRWERHVHHCPSCAKPQTHVIGDNRSVCTECGSASWVPDPQYTDAS